MDDISGVVRDWVVDTGQTATQVARQAGVSQSTLSRVLGGRVDPTFGTLVEIALACGFELDLVARPSSNPDAARAARSLLESGYPGGDDALAAWRDRLLRLAGGDDPVALLRTAARYAAPLLRPEAELFTGEVTLGRVASAGDAAGGRWAVSGAPGLTLPRTDEPAPPVTVLWTEEPRRAAQLLADSALQRTTRPGRADIAVLPADPALFTGTFTAGIVVYAAPIQLMLDCLAQGGRVAGAALAEVASW